MGGDNVSGYKIDWCMEAVIEYPYYVVKDKLHINWSDMGFI
ncbi:MAG: hypothetical protein ACUVWP_09500 [bacterium]